MSISSSKHRKNNVYMHLAISFPQIISTIKIIGINSSFTCIIIINYRVEINAICFIFDFICKGPPPRITVAKSTPTTPRKDIGPTSQPQRAKEECESSRALPKSISFTSETEYQKQIQSPAQVNYVAVNFQS